MAIKMTRAEYEAKYGVQPPVSGTQNKSVVQNQTTPIKMTRAEYEAKYGKQNLQAQGLPVSVRKDRVEPTAVGGIIREIVKQPLKAALSVARPFVDPLGKKDFSFDSKYLGNVGDYGTEIEKSSKNLANKYKAGDISLGRAAIGGAGAGALQAMDAASVVPVGGVAGSAVKGTLKEALIPTLKTAAKESAIRGGVIGTGYDVSSQLASGEKYNPVQTLAAGTIGTVADLGLSYGLPKALNKGKDVVSDVYKTRFTPEGKTNKIVSKRIDELQKVENNYSKLRKNQEFLKDANTESRTRVANTDVLANSIDDTGTIRTQKAQDDYRKTFIDKTENLGRDTLAKEGATIDPVSLSNKLKSVINNDKSIKGADKVSALKKIDDEIAGYVKDENGNIPLTEIHDAKVATYNAINDFATPVTYKTYSKSLGRGLKEVIEDISQTDIKNINKELSKYLSDIKYLKSLDGRKVQGGKMGKYFSQISGNIIGGVAGNAVGGPVGSALGTVIGGELGGRIKGNILSKTFSGVAGVVPKKSEILEKAKYNVRQPKLPALLNEGVGFENKAGIQLQKPKVTTFEPKAQKIGEGYSNNLGNLKTKYNNTKTPIKKGISTELPKAKTKSSDLSTGKNRLQNVEDLIKRGYTKEQSEFIARNANEMMDIKSPSVKDVLNNPENYIQQKPGNVTIYRVVPKGKGIENADFVFTSKKDAELFRDNYGYKRGANDIVSLKTDGSNLVKTVDGEYIYFKKELRKANKNVEIEPLIQQAKKYKSAEEFVKAQPKLYHGGSADIKDIQLGKSNFQKTFYMSENPDYAKSFGGNKSSLNEIMVDSKAKLVDLRKPSDDLVKQIEDIISSKPTGKTVRIQKPDGTFLEIPETKGGLSNPVHSSKDILNGIRQGKAYFAEMPEVKNALKKLGYDGMITQESKMGTNFGVWNKDILKTKSQLEEIWNKANKSSLPKPKVKSSDLSTEGKSSALFSLKKDAKNYNNIEDFINSLEYIKTLNKGKYGSSKLSPTEIGSWSVKNVMDKNMNNYSGDVGKKLFEKSKLKNLDSYTLQEFFDSNKILGGLEGDMKNGYKVYRVVPKNGNINTGDFVFTNKKSANEFLEKYGKDRNQVEIKSKIVKSDELILPVPEDVLLKQVQRLRPYNTHRVDEFIYAPKSIQGITKSQLEEIWKKANKK